jgi:hypothetical protein
MGDDLGTSEVYDICPITKYPRDSYGHLLNPISRRDGGVTPNWSKPGTVLANITSPYGHLNFAIGSGDDFYCFDYEVINAGPYGEFIILDSVWNSDTGHHIEGADYEILPFNTKTECLEALRVAGCMVSSAVNATSQQDIKHTERGWNQDTLYFVRCVARKARPVDFMSYNGREWVQTFSERQMRHGGKRIDALMGKIHNK